MNPNIEGIVLRLWLVPAGQKGPDRVFSCVQDSSALLPGPSAHRQGWDSHLHARGVDMCSWGGVEEHQINKWEPCGRFGIVACSQTLSALLCSVQFQPVWAVLQSCCCRVPGISQGWSVVHPQELGSPLGETCIPLYPSSWGKLCFTNCQERSCSGRVLYRMVWD